MPHSRYSAADAYILEELKRQYEYSDTKGRIRLLRKMYRRYSPPPDILALLAIEDPSTEVRQWIARFGSSLNQNMRDRLESDPDPFVRACLRENPRPYLYRWEIWRKEFDRATHLERLGLVRNPLVGAELIEPLFDPNDQQLKITMEERKELIVAFLTNAEALNLDQGDRLKLGDKIWPLAFRWPVGGFTIPEIIWHVPAGDNAKADVYRSCQDPRFRESILDHCTPDDVRTVALGLKDSDEKCRITAGCLRAARKEQQRNQRPYRSLIIACSVFVFGSWIPGAFSPSLKLTQRTERYVYFMFAIWFLYKFLNQTINRINETYANIQNEYETLKAEVADLREDAGEWCGYCRGWGRVRCFCVFGHAGPLIEDKVE